MKKRFSIDQRVNQNETIDTQYYALCLVDILEFLYQDLKDHLKKEGRYFGVINTYMEKIAVAFNKINKNVSNEEMVCFGKVLFLLKPVFQREYKRLVEKRLSEADTIICIMRKMVQIINEVKDSENRRSDLKEIEEVINNLWNNIRNKSKNDKLFNFADTIKTSMYRGIVGKYNLDSFTISPTEKPKEIMSGSRTKELDGDRNKVVEILM